jgi:iron complex transport system substrate-binding protein
VRGDGQAFWLGHPGTKWVAIQLRDSAGLAPVFPHERRYVFSSSPSIGGGQCKNFLHDLHHESSSKKNRTIQTPNMRIASLLPSATEIIALLGLEQQLVGVSADSDWPAEVVADLPVLNSVSIATDSMTSREIDQAASMEGHRGLSLYHVDPDLLRSVRPDLILTQETCEVCAVSRRDVELATQTLGYAPKVLSLSPVTLDQVLEDIERVARLADVSSDAEVAALRARISDVQKRATGLSRQRVFCMEWLDPPYTAGHWVPQMVDIAGGRDELGSPAGPSRRIDWQDIVAYAPEVIVLMPCSLDLERVAAEFAPLRSLPGWHDLPAVQSGQVFAGHTHLFSRAGPRLVDGVEVLARMLHPDVFAAPIPAGQALKMAASGERLEAYR